MLNHAAVHCPMNKALETRLETAAAFFHGRPGIGLRCAADLWELLRLELAPFDPGVLEQSLPCGTSHFRALPPRTIYHVLASNLSVSAETSLLIGWMLGARMWFKLPSSGLPDFQHLVSRLPHNVPVALLTEHDVELMNHCDAVVAYGSDEAIAAVRAQLRGTPRFLAYGGKIALGWLPPGAATPQNASQAAAEIAAFQQKGCLSPQAYLCARLEDATLFAQLLTQALQNHISTLDPSTDSCAVAAIQEWRLRAHARGDAVHQLTSAPGPTVVLRRDTLLEPGPGYGCVSIFHAPDPLAALQPWAGKISTVSVAAAPPFDPAIWEWAAACRIPRLCPIGHAQSPPLTWRHDGRPRISDLITWISTDPA